MEDSSHRSWSSILLSDLASRGVLLSVLHPPSCPELPKSPRHRFCKSRSRVSTCPINNDHYQNSVHLESISSGINTCLMSLAWSPSLRVLGMSKSRTAREAQSLQSWLKIAKQSFTAIFLTPLILLCHVLDSLAFECAVFWVELSAKMRKNKLDQRHVCPSLSPCPRYLHHPPAQPRSRHGARYQARTEPGGRT